MSEEIDESMMAGEAPARMPLGAILAAARKQHRLSVDDVSAHLRLSPRQVMALESDDFAALPEAMITRGFIRNYARLLGIDAEPLLQAYREYAPSSSLYAISIPSANIPILNNSKRSWKPYFIASVVIVLLLGMWVIYMDYLPKKFGQQSLLSTMDSAPQQVPATSVPMPAGLPPVTPTTELVNPAPLQPAETPPASDQPAATESAAGTTAPAETAVTTPTIKLNFSGESWVSVTDASNKKLLDTIKAAGSEEIVHGEPPFKIVIGNAAVSQLVYNDKPIDLAPYTKLNVARVTLE